MFARVCLFLSCFIVMKWSPDGLLSLTIWNMLISHNLASQSIFTLVGIHDDITGNFLGCDVLNWFMLWTSVRSW